MTHLTPLADVDYSRFRFRSTLHLTNLSHVDAGLYTCKVISRRHSHLEKRVFLFIRDLDHPAAMLQSSSQEQEASSSPNQISLPVGSGFIPCRPAHPEFHVQLLRDGMDVSRRFRYFPDAGFAVRDALEDPAALSGEYECLFSSLHVFEESRTVNVVAVPGKKFGVFKGGGIFNDGGEEREDGESENAATAVDAIGVTGASAAAAFLVCIMA